MWYQDTTPTVGRMTHIAYVLDYWKVVVKVQIFLTSTHCLSACNFYWKTFNVKAVLQSLLTLMCVRACACVCVSHKDVRNAGRVNSPIHPNRMEILKYPVYKQTQ